MRVLIIGGTGTISTATTQARVKRGSKGALYHCGGTVAEIPDAPAIDLARIPTDVLVGMTPRPPTGAGRTAGII